MPVTHVMVETREPYEVAVAGVPWEKVAGELTFSIDPDNPCNAAIADLQLAPRNASGQVEFTSDFCLIAPTGQGSGVGRVLVDVVNRGRKTALDSFNRGAGSVADTLVFPIFASSLLLARPSSSYLQTCSSFRVGMVTAYTCLHLVLFLVM